MITCIIIDDERLARSELRKMLEIHPEINIIDEAVNAADAIQKIDQHQPQLIFLDIQMPANKTGFDVLETITHTPHVIFTTAYDQYALKAFEYNALDYILKPIDSKRLHDAIQKVKTKIIPQLSAPKRNLLSETDQVFVKEGERCWFVKLAEVRLFESVGNYSKVYFGKYHPLILKSLNALEDRLDPKLFFRANRKHIINLRMIQKIDSAGGNMLVYLSENEIIEISRRQAVLFKEMMSL